MYFSHFVWALREAVGEVIGITPVTSSRLLTPAKMSLNKTLYRESFMSHVRLVLLMAVVSFLPLYGQTKSSNAPHSVASSQRDAEELKTQIAALQKKVETLEGSINLLYAFLKDKQDRTDSVTLDLTEPAYQRLDTDNGFFLISSGQAIKIPLKIGNPLSVSFSGFKVKIKWAKAYDYKQYEAESYGEWQKSIQEKEISFTDMLEKGTWNKIELILNPATADQLGWVNVTLNTNTVRMYEK